MSSRIKVGVKEVKVKQDDGSFVSIDFSVSLLNNIDPNLEEAISKLTVLDEATVPEFEAVCRLIDGEKITVYKRKKKQLADTAQVFGLRDFDRFLDNTWKGGEDEYYQQVNIYDYEEFLMNEIEDTDEEVFSNF